MYTMRQECKDRGESTVAVHLECGFLLVPQASEDKYNRTYSIELPFPLMSNAFSVGAVLHHGRNGSFRHLCMVRYFRDSHASSLYTTGEDHFDAVLCFSAQPALKKASILVG